MRCMLVARQVALRSGEVKVVRQTEIRQDHSGRLACLGKGAVDLLERVDFRLRVERDLLGSFERPGTQRVSRRVSEAGKRVAVELLGAHDRDGSKVARSWLLASAKDRVQEASRFCVRRWLDREKRADKGREAGVGGCLELECRALLRGEGQHGRCSAAC
ncbi:hypothetical protein L1887_58165 [Cichorium endivia]|nr:hypothetical protein L1887_58165 [Cichorium endivia]